jgi:formylglycine-generating enzyme required for sulfatase activity
MRPMSNTWLIVMCLAACKGPDSTSTVPSKPVPVSKSVSVEAGWFASGCVELPPGTKRIDAVECLGKNPPRRLWVSTFEIDELEVSVEQYSACVAATICSKANYKDDRETPTAPVLVRFDQAASYCAWRGQRLPTEAEWEKAARGTDGRMYPWGNEPPTCQTAALIDDAAQFHRLNCEGRLASVGTHPQDRSPYGALDMAGNAPEWTSDLMVADKGEWKDIQSPGVIRFADPNVIDPTGPTPEARLAYLRRVSQWRAFVEHPMRGGTSNAAVGTRDSSPIAREPCDADDCHVPLSGFRCARTSPIKTAAPIHPPVPEATIDVTVDTAGNVHIQSTAL